MEKVKTTQGNLASKKSRDIFRWPFVWPIPGASWTRLRCPWTPTTAREGGVFGAPSSDLDPEIPFDGWGEHRLLNQVAFKKMQKWCEMYKRNDKNPSMNSSVCLCLCLVPPDCGDSGKMCTEGCHPNQRWWQFDAAETSAPFQIPWMREIWLRLRFSTKTWIFFCAFGTQTCEYASLRR